MPGSTYLMIAHTEWGGASFFITKHLFFKAWSSLIFTFGDLKNATTNEIINVAEIFGRHYQT